MTDSAQWATTGLDGLDQILDGLRIGDNVVWTVDAIEDYRYFTEPFVRASQRDHRKIVYFRFAEHPPLVDEHAPIIRHQLDAHQGFESFTSAVHRHIAAHGPGTFYLFDCLSDLLSAWATDQMVGNFFRVTCPYLYRLDTIAYFGVIRANHSFLTIARIRQTTQVMIGAYSHGHQRHVHPFKVWQRHSPTMFLPHEMRDGRFVPIANSYQATSLLSDVQQRTLDSARRRLDSWDRLYLEAEAIDEAGPRHPDYNAMVSKICRVMISQDPRILDLARRYLSLAELLRIKSRMIGTGVIGGKAVGMLLARKILQVDDGGEWQTLLEPHDSFYVGSDVFYSYLVHNGWWELLMRQKTEAGYFEAGEELAQKMLAGAFPSEFTDALQQMLEYFGQYPLIVRSSSLLEDGFSGAFAGKYESFFCVNQGSPEQRLEQLVDAVRRIFASTMSRDALSYRRQRGLAGREEPMGLLVQRVSGKYRQHYYLPDLAGVGVSYNTFVWSRDMDPRAGMVRLVMGLGTRAVDRVEGDYPCTAALDQPLRRPYEGDEGARRFSQRDVDVLDVEANDIKALPLSELTRAGALPDIARFAVRDRELEQRARERGRTTEPTWRLTFEPLMADASFVALTQRLLKTLERAYDYPVDIEFTINFDASDKPRINLVQCRPLQTRGADQRVQLPERVDPGRLFFSTAGNFMGGSVQIAIDRVIWVDPRAYMAATNQQRYELARLVGRVNQLADADEPRAILLCGPGRWGTSTPSLGVPVRFSEINNMTALVEIASHEMGIVPELSYGTHFFQDLVESNTFYAALAVDRSDCELRPAYLQRFTNRLATLIPEAAAFADLVGVYDMADAGLTLYSDVVSQQAICCEEG